MSSGPSSAIFVSSQSVDQNPARLLIDALATASLRVDHSPSNPLDRDDDRWPDWYEKGLRAALRGCRLFVIVVDAGWDSSSWMAQEAQSARESRMDSFFWNPTRVSVRAKGMTPYLKVELPVDLEEAVRSLRLASGGLFR
jgi:hypothetical protein